MFQGNAPACQTGDFLSSDFRALGGQGPTPIYGPQDYTAYYQTIARPAPAHHHADGGRPG